MLRLVFLVYVTFGLTLKDVTGSPVNCGSEEIRCADGVHCFKFIYMCDGDNDCPDGSDESNCGFAVPRNTTSNLEDSQETQTDTNVATVLESVPKDTTPGTPPDTTPATTICIKNVPEDSHIGDFLSSTNRSSDGVNALTDGRYYLFHFELNWFQAIELCHQIGLRAATFNSELDYNQLTALIRQKNGYDLEASYWTAGSDLGKRGKWVWHPLGRPLMYTRWGRGEPSNSESDNPVERCLEIKGAKGYTMNDCPCDIKYYVICENNV